MAFVAKVLIQRNTLSLGRITVALLQKLHFAQSRMNCRNDSSEAKNGKQLEITMPIANMPIAAESQASADQLEESLRKSLKENDQNQISSSIRQAMHLSVPLSTEVIVLILGHVGELSPDRTLEIPLQFLKARLYWSQGNIDKALALMEKLHGATNDTEEDSHIRLYCRKMFYYLIQDALHVKSEAVLRKTCTTIEKLDEVVVLEHLWQRLFLSEWFSDQQLAISLFSRHESLRIRFSVQKNYFTFLLLKDHNVDAVYRLIELLLAHDMLPECRNVLGLLFDYQFWRQDLRSCSEIIQTSIGLGLELESDYGRKLVHLLLSPKERPPAKITIPKDAPKIEYKF